MKTSPSILAIALLVLGISSCQSYSFGHRDPNCDPDARLAGLRDAYETAKGGAACGGNALVDCDRARNAIERLALEFPAHVPTLMTNAVLAHDAKEDAKSARYLDRLFAVEPVHADAAVLRAELWLGDGNLQGARRLVETQIGYAPDHSRLREVHACVLVLAHDLEGARSAITTAEKLGAPACRVALNRGWIAQEAGDAAEARRQYQAALDADPACQTARSRLAGMNAGASYNGATSPPGKAGGG